MPSSPLKGDRGNSLHFKNDLVFREGRFDGFLRVLQGMDGGDEGAEVFLVLGQ